MFRREWSDSVPPRVTAGLAKMAVRSGGPCTNAGPPRVARPARTARIVAASRPKVVMHAGISKARVAVAQPMSRVARAPGRGPKVTVVARPTIAVRKAKPAPGARPVVQAKQKGAGKPAASARQLPKAAPRKSPPVGPSAEGVRQAPPRPSRGGAPSRGAEGPAHACTRRHSAGDCAARCCPPRRGQNSQAEPPKHRIQLRIACGDGAGEARASRR